MKSCKSLDKYSIPAGIFTLSGSKTVSSLHKIIKDIWKTEEILPDFKDAIIVTLCKNKGDKSDCGNSG